MGHELMITCIPYAQMTAERISQLHDLVDDLDARQLEFDGGFLNAEEHGTIAEMRRAVHEAVDIVADAEERWRNVDYLEFPELPYTIMAAGGYSHGDLPSDEFEAFCIINSCDSIREQVTAWAKEDKAV